MSLTTRVTNDYASWTKGANWVLYDTNTKCSLTSPNSTVEYNQDIKRSFALSNPAHQSEFSIVVQAIEEDAGWGIINLKVILQKPISGEVTLAEYNYDTGGWVYPFSVEDINSYLNETGTYWLILRGNVKSEYNDPIWENNEVHGWTVLLKADDTKPSQITGVNAHAESTASIHVLWTADGEATQYYIYYKKTTDSTWSYVSVSAPTVEKIVTGLDSATMYDIKVAGYNLSGEGTHSSTIQMRTLGTVIQNLTDTVTPTESFTKTRVANVSFSETITPTEDFSAQRLTSTPTSTSILLCGITGSYVYTFETGLISGVFETAEIDFGYPDKEKTLKEVRFGSESETPHTISVYVSTNGGSTWTLIGSDTTYLGKTGYVHPWVTSKRFIVRFSGSGLRLYFYELYANPAGWSVKTQ